MTFRLIRRAFFIALVVGSILNVINQYDAFFGEGRYRQHSPIVFPFAYHYLVLG